MIQEQGWSFLLSMSEESWVQELELVTNLTRTFSDRTCRSQVTFHFVLFSNLHSCC